MFKGRKYKKYKNGVLIAMSYLQYWIDCLYSLSVPHDRDFYRQQCLADLINERSRSFYDFYFQKRVSQTSAKRFITKLERLDKVISSLRRIMKPDFIVTWLQTPNTAFSGEAPKDLLDSDKGTEKILTMIHQLESGAPT